jgi:hypothetical protein
MEETQGVSVIRYLFLVIGKGGKSGVKADLAPGRVGRR